MPKTFKTKAKDTTTPTPDPEPTNPTDFKVELEEDKDGKYLVDLTYVPSADALEDVKVYAVINNEEVLLEQDALLESAEIEKLIVRFKHSNKEYEFELNEGEFELVVHEYVEEPNPDDTNPDDNKPGGSTGGGMSCSFGGYYVGAFIGACALLLLVTKKNRG